MELFELAELAYLAYQRALKLESEAIAIFASLEKPVQDAWISAVTQVKAVLPLPELLQLAKDDAKKHHAYSEMVTCSSKIEQAQVWYDRYVAHVKKDTEAATTKADEKAMTEAEKKAEREKVEAELEAIKAKLKKLR